MTMRLGRLNDDHTCRRRKVMHKPVAVIPLALLLSTALILTIVATSLVNYNSALLEVYFQLNIKSAEASTDGAPATENNTSTSETSTPPQNTATREYENPVFGLNVEYPVTWSAFELNSKFRDNATYAVALLRAPLDNASDRYAERININMQKLNSNNVTLDAYTSAILRAYQNITGVKILNSSATTLAGQPAHRVVYTDDRVAGANLVKNQVWSIINGSRAFVITFGSEESKYLDYLPQVQNMLSSLKFASASDNPEQERQLSFEDPIFGINLQYPSSWAKVQLAQPPRANVDLIAAFFHQENRNASISRIGVATQQLVSQNVNLQQYTANQLKAIERVNATDIQDEATKIGDNSAHSAVFNLNGTKVKQIWTLEGDKAYLFAYQASPSDYPKELATFQKIANSLVFKQ